MKTYVDLQSGQYVLFVHDPVHHAWMVLVFNTADGDDETVHPIGELEGVPQDLDGNPSKMRAFITERAAARGLTAIPDIHVPWVYDIQ